MYVIEPYYDIIDTENEVYSTFGSFTAGTKEFHCITVYEGKSFFKHLMTLQYF